MHEKARSLGCRQALPQASDERRVRNRSVAREYRGATSAVRRAAYRLPDPVRSEADFLRFTHADVAAMPHGAKWAEHYAARRALADLLRSDPERVILDVHGWPTPAVDWLRERIRHTRTCEP